MEKSRHYDRNVKTVQAVKDAGSDFSKLHAIEHHLYCYTEESYDLLMTLGREAGYEVAHEGRHEGEDGPFWSLDLVRKSTPDIFSIEKQALEIEAMVEKADADYDGWGTEIES